MKKPPRHQHIYNLAELCAMHEIQDAVICPGSRSAPLVLGFSNHKAIKCRVIPDERTAGFIALGIAQAKMKPVVVICTSGTATYNLAPAVAEAYYQQIPLLIATADRPQEWIDQRDGQTIKQSNIYGNHVKKFFNVNAEDQPEGNWLSNRMINEAIISCLSEPSGPVHLNFPFREPLYPSATEKILFQKSRIIKETGFDLNLKNAKAGSLIKTLSGAKRILMVGGQLSDTHLLLKNLKSVTNIAVVGEILSNLHTHRSLISKADTFLASVSDKTKKQLRPDLLITWGKGIISKNTKLFLRNYPARQHWHIQPAGDVADTFKNLTNIIKCKPEDFISDILLKSKSSASLRASRNSYFKLWADLEKSSQRIITAELTKVRSEASIVREILNSIPNKCDLHFANSMSVRHGNLVGLRNNLSAVRIFSNRGTSGIDGCTSTVVGHQLSKTIPQVLLTGDVAFFYDSNAFWHNERIGHLRICLINNQGGRIFQIIDGPRDRKELERYFVGPQPRNAENFCRDNRIDYSKIQINELSNFSKLKSELSKFFNKDPKIKLIEFFCNSDNDLKVIQQIRQQLKDL